MNTQHLRQTNDDHGTGRTEAFSDGVIAVAITLLILDIHVPTVQTRLLQALLNQWPSYLGYVTSFLVITIFRLFPTLVLVAKWVSLHLIKYRDIRCTICRAGGQPCQ